jgi:hypothetical protein
VYALGAVSLYVGKPCAPFPLLGHGGVEQGQQVGYIGN